MTIIEESGIPALLSLCNSPDLMSQYYVGCALANLSCSLSNHPEMVEKGGIQALIALACSPDPDVHQQAVAALRGLAVTTANKMKIVQDGALTPLSRLLASDDVEILREVVATLANLSVTDETKFEIVKAGTLPALISLTQSTDMVVSSQSCATLANLAEVPKNQLDIAENGAIAPCIHVMRSKYIEVQREAGRLLANLCAAEYKKKNSEDDPMKKEKEQVNYTKLIITEGGHSLLISYLLSNDTACQRVGSMGICNLCTQEEFRELLIKSGVLEPLCSLARSEDVELEIQRYSVLAIASKSCFFFFACSHFFVLDYCRSRFRY
jgi:vacuolar protein 8